MCFSLYFEFLCYGCWSWLMVHYQTDGTALFMVGFLHLPLDVTRCSYEWYVYILHKVVLKCMMHSEYMALQWCTVFKCLTALVLCLYIHVKCVQMSLTNIVSRLWSSWDTWMYEFGEWQGCQWMWMTSALLMNIQWGTAVHWRTGWCYAHKESWWPHSGFRALRNLYSSGTYSGPLSDTFMGLRTGCWEQYLILFLDPTSWLSTWVNGLSGWGKLLTLSMVSHLSASLIICIRKFTGVVWVLLP